MDIIGWTIGTILMLVTYCAPIIIAVAAKHPNTAPIAVVNVLLGWTGIGWVVALAWSLSNISTRRAVEF